jgi:hypothetical protein
MHICPNNIQKSIAVYEYLLEMKVSAQRFDRWDISIISKV